VSEIQREVQTTLAYKNFDRFLEEIFLEEIACCFGALDLSSNTDIAAWGRLFGIAVWGVLFGLDNGYWLYLPKFYLSEVEG